MPIPECDPWREQYFAHIPCPPDVIVPTDDMVAWELYPQHRWVYNKLRICETQGIECAPHGVEPKTFPVFSKPIYNLRGMGIGSRGVHDAAEMHAVSAPGHLWMRLLEGEHLSTDVAVVRSAAKWWRHARGVGGENGGMFDHWIVYADARPALEGFLGGWLSEHLREYTGMVNFETIGGRIIECHLRFSDQWPDLYGGDPWVKAVVELYKSGKWEFEERERREGYSVVLWSAHAATHVPPSEELAKAIRDLPGVSSLQITFDTAKASAAHAMPPGGFRIAIVNCWKLEGGRLAMARIEGDSRSGGISERAKLSAYR